MIKLEIVTPEKKVFDESVDSVTVPTANGEIGILSNHSPLIATLKPGILTYTVKGTSEKLVVSGGFVEVSTNKVSVLADIAEKSEEVDVEAAKVEKANIEKVLAAWSGGSVEDFEAESEKLEKAQARLQLASGR